MVTAQDLGLNPERFQVFEGVYRDIMPQLVAAGFEPENPGWVLDQRNDAVGKPHQSAAWDNYFDTDCGIAGDTNRIYVAPHSPRLRAVTPQTRLVQGGIPLPSDDLSAMVRVYERNEHILSRDLTEQEARENQLWLDWADGNQARLDRYVENTFRLGKDSYKYDTMMGIFVPEDAVERALFVYWLGSRSPAFGNYFLNYGTRLVGVRRGEAPPGRAPEKREVPGALAAAPEMKVPSIEEILAVSQQYVPECGREGFQADIRKLYKP